MANGQMKKEDWGLVKSKKGHEKEGKTVGRGRGKARGVKGVEARRVISVQEGRAGGKDE